MTFTPAPRLRKLLQLFSFVSVIFIAGVSVGRSQLTFTIDTFTTEELKITLNAGGTLTGSASNSNTILYITADSFNRDWILKDNAAKVVGSTASLGDDPFDSGVAENHITAGDFVSISFGNLVTGDSLSGPLQLSMGHLYSGGFDPSAVSNLVLSWGNDGQEAGTQPWGVFQSSTAVTAVPEPATTTILMGLASVLGIFVLRRRRAASSQE